MMHNAIDDQDIHRVIDGFIDFFRQNVNNPNFEFAELKKLMEPIFRKTGYRSTQGGGGNILILHEGAVGDFIAASAAIREIRRIYPSAHITLIVRSESKNLAECCPYIDELIAEDFRLDNKTFQSLLPTMTNIAQVYKSHLILASEKLLRRRYNLAFAYTYADNPSMPLLAYMSGAEIIVSRFQGFGLYFPLITEVVPQKSFGYHAADAALGYVEQLIKAPLVNRELEAWVDQADLEFAQSILPSATKLYAIGLGGAAVRKHYPPKFYAEFINMLLREDSELHFVIIGGKTDIEDAAIVMANVESDRVLDLAGKTTFRQTTAVLSFCSMYIGNDSSAMHLAVANALPCLNPNCFPLDRMQPENIVDRWYPYGVPSMIVCPSYALEECRQFMRFTGCIAKIPHCITQITPQNLFDAYKILLERIAENNSEPLIIGSI